MTRWQRILAAPAVAGRAIGRGIAFLMSPFDLRDAMLFGGVSLLGFGLYQVYQPAAFIVPGAIFVAVATLGTR
jgi:hypothetical protein